MSGLDQRSLSKSIMSSVSLTEPAPSGGIVGQSNACVTILLCTYNGERFLERQLASIESQSHRNWQLVISDDGSTDETLALIRDFSERVLNNIELRDGPRQGACANFLSLACDPSISGDYFAFCDQDDLWHPDKLSRALGWLQDLPQDIPAAYGARTRLVDTKGRPIGFSPHFREDANFANALVQNIAGANTMLFNRAAKHLLERAGAVTTVCHDWWVYQLVCGAGGVMRYDSEAHVDYRQHAGNQIGCNQGWRANWQRMRFLFARGFADWNTTNSTALHQCADLLTADNRALLDTFDRMRQGPLRLRLRTFFSSRLRRQTVFGNAVLLTAILFNKL